MEALRVIVTIVYILVCIALIVVVLMQEGKQQGLSGAIAGGGNDSFWSKNKGRSVEGTLSKLTKIFAALFIVLSVVLNFLQ